MKDWLKYRYSEDAFIYFNQKKYSFKDINNTVYDRVLSFIDFGIKKDDKVALFLEDPLDFIEVYLACYQTQVCSIPLNFKWKKNELKNALELVSPDFIICNYKDKNLFTELNKPIIFIEELSKSFGSCYPDEISDSFNYYTIQSILFTSGTEGLPKPVCLTYNNFYQSSMKWIKAIDLNKSDTYLLSLPLYHISGLAIIMRALHVGFAVNIDKPSSGISNADVFSVVPTMLIELIKRKENIENLKKIRCIVLSGSKTPKSLLVDCERHGLNIFLSYGMTETCSSICGFWPLRENKNMWKTVGKPFDGVNIEIKKNQVVIRSNTVMEKYFNGKNIDGQFETSDIGSFENNYLKLNGRLDNIVVSGGENIDQAEIIKAISSIGDFDKIIPFKKEDDYWGEINGVYIHTNERIKPDDIKVKLKKLISGYKIPKEIIIRKSNN